MRWDGELVSGEMSEVWSWRSPSGCGDPIWPTGGRVQPPRRGGVVAIMADGGIVGELFEGRIHAEFGLLQSRDQHLVKEVFQFCEAEL